MLLKRLYKPDLTNTQVINNKKNVLSFHTENKTIKSIDYLQITELGWRFVWLMFKTKLKRNRLFLCVTPNTKREVNIDFFKIKKKKMVK